VTAINLILFYLTLVVCHPKIDIRNKL